METRNIISSEFYNEYHGHNIPHLTTLHSHLRTNHNIPLIFLAGDSSLDNKHWFNETDHAVNGYESILNPPMSNKDIAYWMNKELVDRGLTGQLATINCAIEESTLSDRTCGHLRKQDIFIMENIQRQDVLIVSVGGNDIALRPSPCTILNLLSLVNCTCTSCIEKFSCGSACPCDDLCMGCSFGCLSNICAFPCGMGYFIHLFKTRIEAFVRRMTQRCRPRIILVCMIYFLDETPGSSWAEPALRVLQYNTNPRKLQVVIERLFILATSQIHIEGSKVIPVPLYQALNGKLSADYVERVEPSASGGYKVGSFLIDEVLRELHQCANVESDNIPERH